ncbi:Hypothetical protein FKW44_006003 [Caligus rogercresseyi]|uniref:Uncharacterized protein n=1 Tax=Caligus rogercresseyi TaxID=217165 RepID=A0A7T8KCT8_CALRO|nr:Hypothetical protein FKW44_006003 [Caligus rogercresseyi]
MKETLLKAGVDIADVLAQQKVLAMLPPSYNAAEAWPKWVESALRDQAKVAAAASRSQVVGPTSPDPGIGALYKMEGLQLFALWLEEKHPPLEQEAAVFHATSEKENKEAKVIPPPPRQKHVEHVAFTCSRKEKNADISAGRVG